MSSNLKRFQSVVLLSLSSAVSLSITAQDYAQPMSLVEEHLDGATRLHLNWRTDLLFWKKLLLFEEPGHMQIQRTPRLSWSDLRLDQAVTRATVNVNNGFRLTEADLNAGVFMGQPFTLSPSTVFEINAGGAIGPVGTTSPLLPFSFAGSIVNINNNGLFDSSSSVPSVVSNVVLNVLQGGAIGNGFTALSGSNITVSGGSLGGFFQAGDGSVVNITAGSIEGRFTALNNSTVNISGGVIADNFRSLAGSLVNISGGEFALHGTLSASIQDGLFGTDVFTGTLADGTVFILSAESDLIEPFTITSNTVTLPQVDTTPIVVSTGAGPEKGLRPGQSLTLQGDALIRDHFAAVGATLNIEGGVVGDGLEVASSNVNITGGILTGRFNAFSGSTVNISNAASAGTVSAHNGSTVNISGGDVQTVRSEPGGIVNISGGVINSAVTTGMFDPIFLTGNLNITGGQIGNVFIGDDGHASISGGVTGAVTVRPNGQLDVSGSEFMLDGNPISGGLHGLPTNGVLTGTYADGTVFIFGSGNDDIVGELRLNNATVPPVDTTPIIVSTGPGPNEGLRQGQTLTLQGNATLRNNFATVGATLNIEGGSVGNGLETAFSQVNITDGVIGEDMSAYSGSVVNIEGGTIGPAFTAFNGSIVNIEGGTIGPAFTAFSGSIVNIRGGLVDDIFIATPGSEVNLFVQDAFLDGVPLDIMPGESMLITQRGGSIFQATLADGSFFDLTLNDISKFSDIFTATQDLISSGALFTVSVVPTPGGLVFVPLLGGACALRRRRRG